MHDHYDMLVISPHLDDAALSCGGQIYLMTSSGKRVLMVTLMAGDSWESELSDYAQDLHRRWQLDHDAAARRRDEDNKAAQILGADNIHLSYPDCIYRRNQITGLHFYRSDEAIFAEVDALEGELIQEISKKLDALPPSDKILCPFGIGNHVDHQIARSAAEAVFAGKLFYYEEYPYAAEPEAKNAFLTQEDSEWNEIVIPLSKDAMKVKLEAISAYESQLSTFFKDQEDLERQVREYVKMAGGERMWQRKYSIA